MSNSLCSLRSLHRHNPKKTTNKERETEIEIFRGPDTHRRRWRSESPSAELQLPNVAADVPEGSLACSMTVGFVCRYFAGVGDDGRRLCRRWAKAGRRWAKAGPTAVSEPATKEETVSRWWCRLLGCAEVLKV
nr:hypothetical protein Iba_chr01dCG6220 [Ipomoea batatas]